MPPILHGCRSRSLLVDTRNLPDDMFSVGCHHFMVLQASICERESEIADRHGGGHACSFY
jgi:hypothetical protein